MEAKEAKSHLHSWALGSKADWEGSIGTAASGPISPLEIVSGVDCRSLKLIGVEDSVFPAFLSKLRD